MSLSGGGCYGGFGGSFTASASFSQASKEMHSGDKVVSEASANCQQYKVKLGAIPPCVSEDLLARLDNMQ